VAHEGRALTAPRELAGDGDGDGRLACPAEDGAPDPDDAETFRQIERAPDAPRRGDLP
jgi:hypothetical protein